jgi:predicted metal-dependent phosphoesterase TrpH
MSTHLLRVDLHSHTYHSPDSIASPEQLVRACLRRGIDCLAVTDHNSIRGALAAREVVSADEASSIKIIVGEEIRTVAGEIMGLFLTEEVPARLSPEESMRRVKDQGGLVGIPHPFDRLRIALAYEDMLRLLPEIDFIEVFNARIVFLGDNRKAQRFAQEHGLAVSAASDAHSSWEVGRSYVEMADFEGPEEFLASLREGRIVGRLSSPLVHLFTRWAWLRRKLGWRPV